MGTLLPFTDRPTPSSPALLVAGGGDGFTKCLPALASGLGATTRQHVAIALAEPVPQKAEQAIRLGAEVGLTVTPYVGLAEGAVCDRVGGVSPIVAFLDATESIRRIFTAPAAENRAVFVYLVLLIGETLFALRMIFTPARDAIARREGTLLFERLQPYLLPTGRSGIFGAGMRSAFRLVEPLLRRWMAEHLAANLPKVLAGLPPTSAPVEVTLDGRRTMPLVIAHHPGGFRPLAELASSVLDGGQVPLRKGEDVAVAELGTAGVHFHIFPTRGTEGRPSTARGVAVGPSASAVTLELLKRTVTLEVNARNAASITD